MVTLTPGTIGSKFHPSIINRDDFADKNLKKVVEKAFSESCEEKRLDPGKSYVFEKSNLPDYVVKGARTGELGPLLAKDTHL